MNNDMDIKDIYKLSPMQKGMLFHSSSEKDETYFEQSCISIQGHLDSNILEISLNKIIKKYDVLRTIIECKYGKEPLQIVIKDRKAKVYFEDLIQLEKHKIKEYINEFMVADRKKGFDLNKDMLLRMSTFRDGEDSYKLIFSFHHIILDGWSWAIVINELLENYRIIKTSPSFDEKDTVPFVNYIKWIEKQDENAAVEFWKGYLKDFEGKASIPHSSNDKGKNIFTRGEYTAILNKEASQKLDVISRQNQITMSSLFQAIWGFILHRYNYCDEVILGSVVSGRTTDISGVESIVGMLINTIPIRLKYSSESKLIEIAKTLHNENVALNKYSYLSFSEIMKAAGLKSNTINNIIAIENYPINFDIQTEEYCEKIGFKVDDIATFEQTNFDFNILVIPGEEAKVNFIYNSYLYDKKMIDSISGIMLKVIKLVTNNPQVYIKDIEVISNGDKEKVLYEFNNTSTQYPLKPINLLFEEQVKKNPNDIALVYESNNITYKKLNEKANQVANFLIKKGVKPNAVVGIIVSHNVAAIIGILGIIKAGAAYLPIDNNYPVKRIKHMLQDSNVKIVLNSDPSIAVKLEEEIANLNTKEIMNEDINNPSIFIDMASVAYVMYSSGSTGVPKGILIEHKSVIRLVKNTNYIDFKQVSRVIQTSTLVFDASILEVWGSLLNGLTLCITDKSTILEASKLHEFISLNNIDTMWLTSSLFNQIAQENLQVFSNIKTLLVGGDIVSPKNVNNVRKFNNNIKIINGYGPTENTTFSACHEINKEYINNIPIGTPISNSKVYIFDSLDYLQPVGAIGEMYLGGDGLSIGYVNNEALTREKFIENPYVKGQRVYKTGDLARWLPDGNLEFMGRKDQQVKIRGYRIELGEIETELLAYEGIKEAVVIDKEGTQGSKYLCAYIVPEGEIKSRDIKEYLSKNLPEYMIPTRYVYMDKLPLTNNGKLNRKELPKPDNNIEIDNEYEAPSNELEEELVGIWEEVLDVKNIGINHNFFELGGDSIKAIQIAARIQKHDMQIEVKDIFKALNIKALQNRIKFSNREISQKMIEGRVPLTPIQIWLMQNPKGIEHFNQAVMLFTKYKFDIEAVKSAFTAIASQHDALRMIYEIKEKELIQYNRGIDERLFDLEIFSLENEEHLAERIKQEADKIQSSIKLQEGPLVKLGIFRTNEGEHLLIVVHHLVIDGISWRILFEDFHVAYGQAVQGQKIVLQKKTSSFKEWAEKILDYVNDLKNEKELGYWLDVEVRMKKIKNISKDKIIEERLHKDMKAVCVELNKDITSKLLMEVNTIYNTSINDILLTALAITISEWTGKKDVLINLEGHGREEIIKDIDISRTIGWFTTMYPIILKNEASQDIGYCIKETKEILNKIPSKGIGYGMFKFLKSCGEDFNVTPEISFNYLGQFDSDLPKGLEMSKFHIGEAISPELHRTYAIDINSKIVNSSLTMEFSYSSKEYGKETIQFIANEYLNNLEKVVHHCLNKTSKEYTPSDFGNSNMDIKELDELFDILESEN